MNTAIALGIIAVVAIIENICLHQQLDVNKEHIRRLQNNINDKMWEIQILEEQLKK